MLPLNTFATSLLLGFLVFLAIPSAQPAVAGDRVFRVLMPEGVIAKVFGVPGDGDRALSFPVAHCPEIDDPVLEGVPRTTIGVLFICHAVRRANAADRIDIIIYPNNKRGHLMLSQGLGDAMGDSIFMSDIAEMDHDFLISDPVLTASQFPVGLFTGMNREDVLSLSTAAELLALRGAVIEHWTMDVHTMKTMPLSEVVTVGRRDRIVPLLEKGRADLTFFTLDTPTTDFFGTPLRRIDGFKVHLAGTRHILFNQAQTEVFESMQDFIAENRAMDPDAILKAYYLSEFLSRDYDHWVVVGGETQTALGN